MKAAVGHLEYAPKVCVDVACVMDSRAPLRTRLLMCGTDFLSHWSPLEEGQGGDGVPGLGKFRRKPSPVANALKRTVLNVVTRTPTLWGPTVDEVQQVSRPATGKKSDSQNW